MGQKVNSIGLRLGVNRAWSSCWYANERDYAKLLKQDFVIRNFLNKEVKQAGVADIYIERFSDKINVNLNIARPGIVIGKKGEGVEKLRMKLQNLLKTDVRLNIVGVKKPEVQAQLVAENAARQLEKRASFRRVMKKAVQQCLKMGGEGIRINCSGRLGGAEIARMEWYREGRVPLHTLRADIDYGEATAHTIYGACGIKVWIYKGDVLDK